MELKKEFEKLYGLIEGLYTHTTQQFTELRAEMSDMKTEIAKNGQAITNLEAAVGRLEQEVKKISHTLSDHELDIRLLKKAVV